MQVSLHKPYNNNTHTHTHTHRSKPLMLRADPLKGSGLDIRQIDISMQQISLFLCSLYSSLKISELHQLGQGDLTL